MDLTGQQLNDYRVLRRLGRGAMAEVYLAEQASLARQVALKVLSPDLASDSSYVDRFQHEARAAAALVHAGIVQIYEVGRSNGYHYIAQEYVPGRNVGELIDRHGRLEPALTLDVLRQVASALLKAAERGIVHRDIKPENVMIARSGDVKVADFGLARVDQPEGVKLTQVGVTMGTPLYMSPEQIEGKPVDARSDIYSLGVTAYHMLSGEPPFRGETPLAVAVQHLNSKAPPLMDARPDAPSGLARLVDRMIAKKPGDRPESPITLLAELRSLAKQAAEQGWGEGPENWSIAEMLTVGGDSEATAQLGRMMRQATEVNRRPRPWRRVVALVGVAAVVGGVLAAAGRPTPLLAGIEQEPVEKPDVLRQIFHAKMVGASEEAWLAVERNFPEADPYYHYLADQNLVGLYLRRQRYEDAIRLCQRLAQAGDKYPEFQRFGEAGVVVCEVTRGNRREAESALAQFPMSDGVEKLRETAPQMATMFLQARRELLSLE
ncbi:MAG: serine/threonine-protein kinase [Planctomycetota bacterium]